VTVDTVATYPGWAEIVVRIAVTCGSVVTAGQVDAIVEIVEKVEMVAVMADGLALQTCRSRSGLLRRGPN
jgi:hypothetical protein